MSTTTTYWSATSTSSTSALYETADVCSTSSSITTTPLSFLSSSSSSSVISTLLASGQLSPLRFVLEIQEATRDCPPSVYHAVFDHFVCRREMADNLCLFNPNYDKIIAAPKWARDTLAKHQEDPRPESYSFTEMETSLTSDSIFNAAQTQLVQEGQIIPEVISYWRQRFLGWTMWPKDALRYCLLNSEKYLVGRLDPTVFMDALEDLFGLNDKEAEEEKSIVGKIPTVSAKSLETMFNVEDYVNDFLSSENCRST